MGESSIAASSIQLPYGYGDVQLSTLKVVNSAILNKSFTKLVDNDSSIFPIADYAPRMWENLWYNDDTIAGYAKGDAMWKGVMTFKSFLSDYAQAIQDYAAGNLKTNSYFKYPAVSCMSEVQRY